MCIRDREYPWGDEFDKEKCNTSESGIGGTTPVSKYSPQGDSPYGCVDMAGNVWEWTADWYGRYAITRQKNPTGPATGTEKILRGGGWDDYRQYLRMPHRYWLLPTYSLVFVGIRCAATDFQGP